MQYRRGLGWLIVALMLLGVLPAVAQEVDEVEQELDVTASTFSRVLDDDERLGG